MIIRAATEHDLDAILAIYNAAIVETAAIWLDDTVDRANRELWFATQKANDLPVIVADIDGVVVGYASFAPWQSKWGYRYTVENSVYVAAGHQGAGIGRSLLTQLIELARNAGIHMMIADIEAGNAPSIGLHESLGFTQTGLIREVGTKFGRWLDLAILQLTLDEPSMPGR
jgi:L-amino acid N-acyltransferase YncA